MTVDVIGTFHVTRLVYSASEEVALGQHRRQSSLGGRFGYPNRSAYCTAKMGLIGFAKTLARELGLALRPNLQYVINPGGTGTTENALIAGLYVQATF